MSIMVSFYHRYNGGYQRLGSNVPAIPPRFIASPLYRVVLGIASIRSGHALPQDEMLPGRWGRTPTRIAQRLTRQRQLTKAKTDFAQAADGHTAAVEPVATRRMMSAGLDAGGFATPTAMPGFQRCPTLKADARVMRGNRVGHLPVRGWHETA